MLRPLLQQQTARFRWLDEGCSPAALCWTFQWILARGMCTGPAELSVVTCLASSRIIHVWVELLQQKLSSREPAYLSSAWLTGQIMTCRRLNQTSHLPALWSNWLSTCLSFLDAVLYWRLNLSGSWKCSWMVPHWCFLPKASVSLMSILGP